MVIIASFGDQATISNFGKHRTRNMEGRVKPECWNAGIMEYWDTGKTIPLGWNLKAVRS